MFLARTITRAKWTVSHGLSDGEIPADAVTADLRTRDNSLSFWRCPSDTASGIEEAALAIAAARERIDRLDIVWLDDDELQVDGQALRDTEGRTPVRDMVAMHLDVHRLDYGRLGSLANRIAASIQAARYRRYSRASVKRLIEQALEQGRIDPVALHATLRGEVVRIQ